MEILQFLLIIVGISFAVFLELKKQAAKNYTAGPLPDDAESVLPESADEAMSAADISVGNEQPMHATDVRPMKQEQLSAPAASPKKVIRLKGKNEAKRAFIYSEIFNRKY